MYALARQLLFRLDAETAHELSLRSLAAAAPLLRAALPKPLAAPVEVMGIQFPNPVGLAAGLDKNGDYLNGLAALGFGFIELGTVTPRPQPGNPRPRLFRIEARKAIVNRMGFNNKGVDHLVAQVKRARYDGVLGINIGKNFDTPVERAVDDYLICLDKVYGLADYIVVNVSSPNTPGLRNLQHGDLLDELLGTLKIEQRRLAVQHDRYVPLVVKIAPDMEVEEINLIADKLLEHDIDGVTATNTTISRHGVEGLPNASETGGLSGAPLFERSTEVVRRLHEKLQEHVPVIGVGGITTGAQAASKIAAGASLVQIYSGLIYQGPNLIRDAVRAIAEQPAASGAY